MFLCAATAVFPLITTATKFSVLSVFSVAGDEQPGRAFPHLAHLDRKGTLLHGEGRSHGCCSPTVRALESGARTKTCRSRLVSRLSKRLPDTNQQLRSGWKARLSCTPPCSGGRRACLRLRGQLPRGLWQHRKRQCN